jgi:hypothetical protein
MNNMEHFEKKIDRMSMIKDVLLDLENLRKISNDQTLEYALNENIHFFESTKSLWSYIKWFLERAPKIDGEKLLEINDLLPKWDDAMHLKLAEMQSKKFPGLIKPAVDRIYNFIKSQKKPLVLISLACGAMELERQLFEKLIKDNHTYPVLIVAVDLSEGALNIAQNNLSKLQNEVKIIRVNNLASALEEHKKIHESKHKVILFQQNIFNLKEVLAFQKSDMAYHTLFKHHLTTDLKNKFELVLTDITKTVVEYDGFKSWINMFPQTIVGWYNPVFLNAEIFSNLRFKTKQEIKTFLKNKKIIHSGFSGIGYYVVEYNV